MLQVMVTGSGRLWRAADRLSVGTAEQVHLLRPSEHRQIVLFAQESTVAAWAAQNLTGEPDTSS
jgi:hypothetical protein